MKIVNQPNLGVVYAGAEMISVQLKKRYECGRTGITVALQILLSLL